MEYRRLFYLFTSISVTGSIDTLMTLISKVLQRQGADENMEDSDIKGFMGPLCTALTVKGDSTVYVAVIIALLHGIAFLSTIIMSQVDIFIAIRGGASLSISPSVWAPVLLSSPGFKSQLNSWQSLGQVRVVCSVLAWAGACYLSYKSVTAVDSKITEISRYVSNISTVYRQCDEAEQASNFICFSCELTCIVFSESSAVCLDSELFIAKP